MPIFGILFGQTIESLPPELRGIAEKFRQGIADALGVPPEAIREDVVVRWVTHWTKAFVKPEYLPKLGLRGKVVVTPEDAYEAGKAIAKLTLLHIYPPTPMPGGGIHY